MWPFDILQANLQVIDFLCRALFKQLGCPRIFELPLSCEDSLRSAESPQKDLVVVRLAWRCKFANKAVPEAVPGVAQG